MGNLNTKKTQRKQKEQTNEDDASPAAVMAAPPETASDNASDYKWPANLYVETRDMAASAFLVYTFGYILDAARAASPEGLKGLKVDAQGHMRSDVSNNAKHSSLLSSSATRRLARSFTPAEILQIVKDNRSILAQRFPSSFQDTTLVEQSLKLLDDRAKEAVSDNETTGADPLRLVEFDDRHQDKEMVYGVALDDINRRITLAFRGTDNQLAKGSNWSTNLAVSKVKADNLPDSIKDKKIWFHKGFYNYIFGATARPDDAPDKKKYDEILEDVVPLLEANPSYKLYVTGHSLGGALASIVALYLASEKSSVVPKSALPITCLSFAAPRVGNYGFRQATNELEQSKRLRFLRIVNDKDSVPMLPTFRFYHAGFQIRLYDASSSDGGNASSSPAVPPKPRRPPQVTYPKLHDSRRNSWSRTWGNSLLTSLNLSYDHGEYRERVEANRAVLEGLDLNDLYKSEILTGFDS